MGTIKLNYAQAAAVTRLMTKIVNGFSLYHVSSIEISEEDKHKRLISLGEAEDDATKYQITVRTDKDERTIVSRWRNKNGFVSLVQVGIDIECLKD